MDTISKLKAIAKQAPKQPGVYFWRDGKGCVLYVGRASSLRSRLSQYFRADIDSRIAEMVQSARGLDFESTETLLEAIILEAENIKKYWPKYNIKDRDGRSFIYVVISKQEKYPKPTLVRGRDLEKFPAGKAWIFGPYQSFRLIQSALRLIRRFFPYSTCRPNQGRACFEYQIGLCPGACLGKIGEREYKKNIAQIRLLLSGKKKLLMKRLEESDPDKAMALRQIQEVALLTREDGLQARPQRLEGYDISHLAGKESYGSMVVSIAGEADPSQYRLFKIKEAPSGDDERALLEVLSRRFRHREWPRPELVLIDGGRPQISFLSRELAKDRLNLPLVGISKLGGDELVFPAGTKAEQRQLVAGLKGELLKLREEAHRFANYGRKRASRLDKFSKSAKIAL